MRSEQGREKPGVLSPYFSPAGIWAFSIGTSIGWGSFVITCNTYLAEAGPLGTLLGLTAGLVIFLLMVRNLQYMIRHNENAGGIYTYAQRASGHDFGFLAAWFLFMTYIAVLWANLTSLPLFARYFLGNVLQFGFRYRIFGYEVYMGEALLVMAAAVLAGLLCSRSRKGMERTMIVLAAVFTVNLLACTVLVLIRKGSGLISEPMLIPDKSAVSQVVRIAVISPWAFIGFENVAHFAGEYRFPVKKIHPVLLASVAATTLLYMAMTVLSVTAYPPEYTSWLEYIRDLGNRSGIEALPAFYAAQHYLGSAGVAALFVALFAVIATSIIGNMTALSRLLYAMGKDRTLPERYARVNRHGVPDRGIWAVVIVSCLIPLLGRTAIGWIVDVTTLGATLIYGLLGWSVYRDAKANGDRADAAAGMAGMAVMIGFATLLLLPNLMNLDAMAPESYILFSVWAVLGLIVFRRMVSQDKTRSYGRSIIVWLILLLLVMFTALAWMNQENNLLTNGVITSVQQFYHEQAAAGAGVPDDAAFIAEQRQQISGLHTRTTVILSVLFLFSVAVMLNNFMHARKREQEDSILLGSARQAANTDPLTGVKSKHAYVQAEELLNRRIAGGLVDEFAVVVCDVNDLKKINDTLGHKAGDEHIRKACRIICQMYKHSPVFRIGGDEFVVLLEGSDYADRNRLLTEINQQVETNKKCGEPVVSVGMAEYVQGQTAAVDEVFHAADEIMYARKKYLKAQFS